MYVRGQCSRNYSLVINKLKFIIPAEEIKKKKKLLLSAKSNFQFNLEFFIFKIFLNPNISKIQTPAM